MEPHATLISSPAVWMEGEALRQLDRLTTLPGCLCAVGMPDLHAGLHAPIGVAVAFADRVRPRLIGGDAGCGARLIGLPKVSMSGDALERRAREATEGPTLPEIPPDALCRAAWQGGPRGLLDLVDLPEALAELCAAEPDDGEPPSAPFPEAFDAEAFGRSLGTTGGGNHFLEASQVEKVLDKAQAARAGLVAGGMAVLAHSGSRGLGTALAQRWSADELVDDAIDRWRGELRGAVRYAKVNRLLLAWQMLCALGGARSSKIGGSFDVVHNTVVPTEIDGQPAWLHRKGCAPAEADQLTVVLGSRGAYSWVMRGLGNAGALSSVAHGAGRKMTRTEATAKVKAKHTRASLQRTALGGRVICDDPALLYEEHPDAYKDVEPVVDALVSFGAATRVAALRPVLTVKR